MSSVESINGNLYLKYYDPHKRYTRRKSLKLKDNQANRRHAQKIAKTYSTNFIPAGFVDADKKYIKLSDAVKEYLAYKNYKQSTKDIYELAKTHLINSAGDKFTREYSNTDYIKLTVHFNTNPKRKLSQNSRSIYTRSLRSLFNYFIKQGYAEQNIIQVVPYQEKVIDTIPRPVVDKILNELSDNLQQFAFVYLGVHTGLRESTLLDLEWNDIDWKRKLISLKNVKVKGTVFTIPLVPKFQKLFKQLGVEKSGKIFPFKDRHSTKFFRRAQSDLKFKKIYGIHKLKHTFISEAIMQGVSIEVLSELTNTTIRTLKKHYTNISKKYLGKELERIQISQSRHLTDDSKNDSKLFTKSAS